MSRKAFVHTGNPGGRKLISCVDRPGAASPPDGYRAPSRIVTAAAVSAHGA